MCIACPQGLQRVLSQVSRLSQSLNFLLNQEVTNLKLVPNFLVSSQERQTYVFDILALSYMDYTLYWFQLRWMPSSAFPVGKRWAPIYNPYERQYVHMFRSVETKVGTTCSLGLQSLRPWETLQPWASVVELGISELYCSYVFI